MERAITSGNVKVVELTGGFVSLAAAMDKAAADGAQLQAQLSLIKGMKLKTTLTGLTSALGKYAVAADKASVSTRVLNGALMNFVLTAAYATKAARELVAVMSFLNAGMGKTARDSAAAATGMGRASKAASGAAGTFGRAAGAADAAAAGMGAAAASANAAASGFSAAGAAGATAASGIGRATRAAQGAGNAARTASQATQQATQQQQGHSNAIRNSYQGWDRFNKSLWEGSNRIRMAGSQAQWTGRQLAFMFTAPAAIAGGIGLKAWYDTEVQITHLRKVYDGAGQDIDKLRKYFEALSNVMGVQQAEVAEIGATWAAAGASGSELAKMTRLTTEAMVLGNMNAEEAYSSLIAIQAQYKLSAEGVYDANGQLIRGMEGVKEILGILNMVENETGAGMMDLSQAFMRSAATARIAGVDARHLAAMISTLVPATGSAAKAGVALNSIFAQIGSPDKGAAEAMLKLGVNANDAAWKSKGLSERLEILADNFVELDSQAQLDVAKPLAGIFQMSRVAQLFGDIARRNGDELSYYGRALRGTGDAAGYMAQYQKELNIALSSDPQKLKQAGVIIQNSLMKAIVPLVPHIVHLAQGIAKLTQSFSELSPQTQKTIMYAVLLLAALGPLAMLFGSIWILVGAMGKTFAHTSKFVRFFAFNILGLGSATKLVKGEVVKQTPLIVRAWRLAHTTMAGVSKAFWAIMRGISVAGWAVLNAIMWLGGKLGLANHAWFEKARTVVSAKFAAARVRIAKAEQVATTRAIAVGGAAQTAAAAKGSAGATAATKRGWGGLVGTLVTILAFFPKQIWNAMKWVGKHVADVGKQISLVFRTAFSGGTIAAEGALARFMVRIVSWFGQTAAKIVGFFKQSGPAIGRAILSWLPRIASIVGRIALLFTGPIGWAIAAIITLIMAFPSQIWNAVKGIGKILVTPFLSAYRAITEIAMGIGRSIGRGLAGIRKIINSVMVDDGIPILAKPFVVAVRVIGKALSALPKIVAAVFRGVVRILQRMAEQIRRALSYLNPFARHSPSLVDNVQAGMAVVTDEYAAASSDIQGSLASAKAAVDDFGRASAGIKVAKQDREREETRTKIAAADPAAAASYDNLTREMAGLERQIESLNGAIKAQEGVVKGLEQQLKAADKAIEAMQDELERLQKIADQVTKSLEAAQSQLDYYANAPITGMRAMSDAIFENEMAQKRLRLEIMKMEDAGGSIDDIANKFANLQGEIETLTGQRNELRNAGAGSDILGEYDKMIADLQAQQGALAQGGVSEIEKAQKELEALQRKGEMLDLENSLKFDPLNRQIEQMVNNLEELSFEEKVAGVTLYKQQVEQLTIAQEAANKAVEAQQEKIDAATDARDQLADRLEAEQEKLQALQDQQDALNQTMDDAQSQIDDTVGALDDMSGGLDDAASSALAGADALGEFEDALASVGDYELPGDTFNSDAMMEDIDKLTEELANQLGTMFDDIDIFGGIKKKWDDLKNWFTGLPGRIGDTISGWGSNVGSWFSGLGSSISGWFSGLWSDRVQPALSSLPGNLANFFMSIPGEIASAMFFIIGYIIGFFITLPGKIRDALSSLGSTLADLFMQALQYLAVNIPIWAHNAMMFFSELPGKIGGFLTSLPEKIGMAFVAMFAHLVVNLPIWVEDVKQWFLGFGDRAKEWMGDIHSKIKEKAVEVFAGFAAGIIETWVDIKQWVKDHMITPLVNGVKEALRIQSPSGVFKDIGVNVVEGMWEGIKGMGSWIWDKLTAWAKEFIPEPVKKALDMQSPSRLFMGIGKNVVLGLAHGIMNNSDIAARASQEMANSVGNVQVGQIAAPSVAAPKLPPMPVPTAPAQPSAPAANPAAGMPKAVEATAQAVTGVMTGMDAELKIQLGGLEAGFGLSFQNIHDGVIALTSDMQLQTAATTDMWSLDIQTKHSAMQLNTLTTSTDWAAKVNTLTTALKDTATATTQAMVDGQISSFTMGRDNMTMLANNTRDNVSTAFSDLSNNLATTMNEGIKPVMDSFDPMLQQVTTWFGDTVGNIGTQWDGVREPVAVPARFIVDEVYNNGIKAAWNKVNGFLGLEPLEDYVAGFASGGAPGAVPVSSLSNPTKPIDVSAGGALKAASSSRDSTLFAGMRGEYVLNKKQVKQWGGIGQLEAWRSNAIKGTNPMEGGGMFTVPGFAEGGRPGVIDEVYKQLGPYKGSTYQYGGGGSPGYDCSGWTGAVHKVLLGQSPQGRIWTTEVDFGSFGYKRGKEGYWSMGVHNGGGGMNSHMAGTLDGVNFESGGAHGTSTWGGPAAGTIHSQFENQYYLPEIGGVFKGSAGGGSGPTSKQLLDEAYRPIMDAVKAKIPTGLPGTVGQMPQSGYDKFDTEVYAFLSAKAAEIDAANASMGNVAYNSTAGVEQWRPTVKEVLSAQGRNMAWDELTLAQMASESGGNPNAINDWDINAQNGTPSKGLMQVIDPTFAAHRDGRYPNDIWNPHANIAAALNYVVSRYGGPEGVWGRSQGYDSGGVLPPGTTQAVNKTGKPEAILTAGQWDNVGTLVGKFGKFIGGFGRFFTLWRKPIKTVPVDTSGKFIGAPENLPGTAINNQPPAKIDPDSAHAFWGSAAAQQASWTADLVKPIEGVENVLAGMPRILGETVVSEWPEPPAPPEPGTPAINLPPDLAQQIVDAVPTTPVPTVPPGTGTGTGTPTAPTTPVPTTPVPSAPGGLTPQQQQELLDMAIDAGIKLAEHLGIKLTPEFLAYLDSIQVVQSTATHTNPSTAQSANAQAQQATGGPGHTATQSSTTIVVNINGDLSMPNIKGGDDAAAFLANLKNLAGV